MCQAKDAATRGTNKPVHVGGRACADLHDAGAAYAVVEQDHVGVCKGILVVWGLP